MEPVEEPEVGRGAGHTNQGSAGGGGVAEWGRGDRRAPMSQRRCQMKRQENDESGVSLSVVALLAGRCLWISSVVVLVAGSVVRL